MNEQQIQQLATAVALAVASVVMVEPVSVVEPVCKPKARKVGKPKAGQVAKKVSKAKKATQTTIPTTNFSCFFRNVATQDNPGADLCTFWLA